MNYHHLTISERIRIEVLSILGYSTRFIAKFLHRHHSTVVKILLAIVNTMMFFLILFLKNYMKTGLQNRFLMHF